MLDEVVNVVRGRVRDFVRTRTVFAPVAGADFFPGVVEFV